MNWFSSTAIFAEEIRAEAVHITQICDRHCCPMQLNMQSIRTVVGIVSQDDLLFVHQKMMEGAGAWFDLVMLL